MNAIDTNVFVYATDSDEPTKQAKAKNLLVKLVPASTRTILLWQVAGELLNCMRRWESRGKISAIDVEDNIRDVLRSFPMVISNENVITRSLSLSSRYSLSHWDSMLLAACIEVGVDTLYSEDLSGGVTYDSVQVVNPFL